MRVWSSKGIGAVFKTGRFAMFYEVKVLSPKGKVKKVISGKDLGRIFWQRVKEQSRQIPLKNWRNRTSGS